MRLSIRAKTTIMVVVFAIVLIASATIICGRVMVKTTNEQFSLRSTNVSKTVEQIIDVDQFVRVRNAVLDIYNSTENKVSSEEWGSDVFNEYVALFGDIEKSDDFLSLRETVRKVQDVNDVDCIYLSTVDYKNGFVIYVVDAAHDDACSPGIFDPVYDINKKVLTDPDYGFPSYVTDTEEYGKLMTSGVPIHDGNGDVVGYVFTDVSMDAISRSNLDYILRVLVFLSLAMVWICIISIVIVNKILVKPLKVLSKTAIGYCASDDSAYHDVFEQLKIKTKDEIEELADSMKQMERDINAHISKLLSVKTELSLSQQVANEMEELATKDALTGVRNKTSYDQEVSEMEERGDTEYGIAMIDLNFLKYTNDTYGHENGNIAIMTLSKVICDVFKHSPIFRVGGDEFIAILRNEDLHNASVRVEDFKKKISDYYSNDKLEPWMRITAAIGVSVFDPKTDKSVADVFNRADSAMYECKRQTKASGVQPI